MRDKLRFGRRVPLPSTFQIRHELVLFGLEDEQRSRLAAVYDLPANASWREIAAAQQRAEEGPGAQTLLSEARTRLDAHERVLETFDENDASPEKGMARLRQGLSENTVRTLENGQLQAEPK